ncbi:membrane protein insertion efficiency factor YidD [Myceligenerans crystallogenes]|uniref:Membrane protein insertion efficiency factor n=1 Tax=Myceligenerans crystallogenes TaxID=316335 RepID=A0ABN2NNZ6_9MICO
MDCDLGCDGCGDNDGCGGGGRGSGSRGCWWDLLSGCDACDLLPDRKDKKRGRRRRRTGSHETFDRTAAAYAAADLVDRVALAAPPGGAAPPPPVRWWSVPRLAGMAAIRLYQRWISPRLPTRCRYTPTCSAYGLQAVRTYGLVTGSRLALGRIRRCTRHIPHGTRDLLPRPSPVVRAGNVPALT